MTCMKLFISSANFAKRALFTKPTNNNLKITESCIMRKLKGAVKENAKQKRERKQEFAKMRQQIHTLVLPTLGVVFLLICIYVYLKSRPSTMQQV